MLSVVLVRTRENTVKYLTFLVAVAYGMESLGIAGRGIFGIDEEGGSFANS